MIIFRSFALIMVVAFLFASGAEAFTSIHPDFKRKFSPGEVGGGKLSTLRSPVPSRFKAFVPPGATKVTMIIYGPQGKVYGAVGRVDNPPQCTYKLMSEKEAEILPWMKPNACTLDQMRKNDCQVNGVDGQVELLSWGMTPLTGEGHWVHVVIRNHARTELAEVNFTVNVDLPAYIDWYESAAWNGSQPPASSPGPVGGKCDSRWAKGGGEAPPPPPEVCENEGESLNCTFKKGLWKGYPDCVCASPEDPPPPPPKVLDLAFNPGLDPKAPDVIIGRKVMAATIETVNVHGEFDLIFLWAGNEERVFNGEVLELLKSGKYGIITGKKGKFVGVKFIEKGIK